MGIDLKNTICALMTQTEIASRIGTTSQAVSSWLNNQIPPERVIPLCEILSWRITPHQMRSDIYPNPTDGLPGQQD
ncbi:transcriptional regulator [Citrobacter farmeri]|uniref:transcriptional regulator n=2 Tax=Citrobacter farmeri TaxID=67824 RepID=UPI0018A9BF9C|nr:YdaS family helix-turn-helix protein [Citrobacter farmeri]MDB2179549.1 YdaS family helix-turn-helix protein [Citrobacter farmeri]